MDALKAKGVALIPLCAISGHWSPTEVRTFNSADLVLARPAERFPEDEVRARTIKQDVELALVSHGRAGGLQDSGSPASSIARLVRMHVWPTGSADAGSKRWVKFDTDPSDVSVASLAAEFEALLQEPPGLGCRDDSEQQQQGRGQDKHRLDVVEPPDAPMREDFLKDQQAPGKHDPGGG